MSIRRRRRRNESGSSSSDTGQMMDLALFIMLLAFFIVLNTLSTYEDVKTEKVRRSIALSFSKEAAITQSMPSSRPDPVQSLKEGHTFDRLDALFESQIMAFEATKIKSRGVMLVRLPYDDFERAIEAIGQKNLLNYPSRKEIRGNFFLPTLASLLRANIDGAPTRMEINVQVKGNPAKIQNQKPKELDDIISKVGAFSQKLEKSGVPKKLINIGIRKGNSKFIELVFRKYVPFSPVEDKEF